MTFVARPSVPFCTKCNDEDKPRVPDSPYFARDRTNPLGIKTVCRGCDNLRKRQYGSHGRKGPHASGRMPPHQAPPAEVSFDIDIDVEETTPAPMNGRVGRSHLVIPDTQVRPGVPTDHLTWIGNYIAAKRPDVIVHLGDHADMPSLNSYAVGKAEAEGTRYTADIASARAGMRKLVAPFKNIPGYNPEMHLTLGNHEYRITRESEANAKLIGTISIDDLDYPSFGWTVHEFLEVATIDGIEYSHYFTTGVMSRPASSAAAMLRQRQSSCIQGHVQKVDIAVHPTTQYIALMAGIAYQHQESYLTPQGQNTKRGVWMLNEIHNGTFDMCFVSLGFLGRRYR